MKYRPGQLLIVGAVILAVTCVGVFYDTRMIAFSALAFVCLFVLAERDRRQAHKLLQGLSIQRSLPVVVGRDRSFHCQIEISNTSQQQVMVHLRDVVPAECRPIHSIHSCLINAADATRISLTYRIPARGKHQFEDIWLRVAGPWRLMEAQHPINCSAVVRVLPETFASRDKLTKDLGAEALLLDKITRTRQHGAGTEFESLHAFRDGDDPRRIDWRATARMRQPIVRRFQVERHRDVMILIDTGRLMGSETESGSKLDCAVDAALNLARVALQSGDRCGVAAYDNEVRGFLPPVAGVQSLGNIVESVYDLQTRWNESDFTRIHAEMQLRQSKRSLLIVLSDLSDAETSKLQCAALKKLSSRHLVLFAALKTPLLSGILKTPTDSILDGAEKAVTLRLLRDRSRALHVLERAGVHILDVNPEEVTAPLINEFVDLRLRNLL